MMLQPGSGVQPLEDACLTQVSGGVFVRRAVYVCRSDLCLRCGLCRESCPHKAIFSHREMPVIDPCLCSDCGLCQKNCPVGAILRTVQLTTA